MHHPALEPPIPWKTIASNPANDCDQRIVVVSVDRSQAGGFQEPKPRHWSGWRRRLFLSPTTTEMPRRRLTNDALNSTSDSCIDGIPAQLRQRIERRCPQWQRDEWWHQSQPAVVDDLPHLSPAILLQTTPFLAASTCTLCEKRSPSPERCQDTL
jgi:hypothetical protein